MHIIHRGIVNKNYKENCLTSFQASFKKRFGIETDIHSTKDKKFVCFHDFTLKRIFKISRSIKNINYEDLKKIKNKNFQIPPLKEVLKISKNKFPVFIEIKPLFDKELLSNLIKETRSSKNYPKFNKSLSRRKVDTTLSASIISDLPKTFSKLQNLF